MLHFLRILTGRNIIMLLRNSFLFFNDDLCLDRYSGWFKSVNSFYTLTNSSSYSYIDQTKLPFIMKTVFYPVHMEWYRPYFSNTIYMCCMSAIINWWIKVCFFTFSLNCQCFEKWPYGNIKQLLLYFDKQFIVKIVLNG